MLVNHPIDPEVFNLLSFYTIVDVSRHRGVGIIGPTLTGIGIGKPGRCFSNVHNRAYAGWTKLDLELTAQKNQAVLFRRLPAGFTRSQVEYRFINDTSVPNAIGIKHTRRAQWKIR